jgi:hypothetical protein
MPTELPLDAGEMALWTGLHSPLGHVPPVEFKQAHYRQNTPAAAAGERAFR